MILHLDDWAKYPRAIIHFATKNESFTRLAGLYKKMGVRNHFFMLALHNPDLAELDPRDEANLTYDQKILIAEEVAINPWYYFREVARAPALSSIDPTVFTSNRANIGLYWLFFNNVITYLIQPRQTGKSFSSDVLMNGLINYWIKNTQVNLLTKDSGLRAENIERLKSIELTLPKYLRMVTDKDADNTEALTRIIHDNKYKTAVAQKSPASALNVGRGMSSSIFQIDEFAFIYNISISLPSALASGGRARDNAKKDGLPNGVIFTTTAGDPTTEAGKYAYGVYKDAMRWDEKLLDSGNSEKLENIIEKNSRGNTPIVLLEFSHRQLGYTDEWLRLKIKESMSTGDKAERDFLNKWLSGSTSSPISAKYRKIIEKSKIDPIDTEIRDFGFVVRWYVSEKERKYYKLPPSVKEAKGIILGLDTSDALGSDDIGLVGRDIRTGEVVLTGKYNSVNLDYFGEFFFRLLLEYKSATTIAERKSSAMAILDKIARLMESVGVDPFKRIFNWVVQEKDAKPERFEEIANKHNNSSNHYVDYKKEFGYNTTGAGKSSRDKLYGEALFESIKYTGNVTRDGDLISQMESLRQKNGRIDHAAKENDDLVIAYCLSYWFLLNGRNVEHYGHHPRLLLSNVNVVDPEAIEDIKMDVERSKDKLIRDEIDRYLTLLANEHRDVVAMKHKMTIRNLTTKLSDNGSRSLNIENRLNEITEEINRKKKHRNTTKTYDRNSGISLFYS